MQAPQKADEFEYRSEKVEILQDGKGSYGYRTDTGTWGTAQESPQQAAEAAQEVIDRQRTADEESQ